MGLHSFTEISRRDEVFPSFIFSMSFLVECSAKLLFLMQPILPAVADDVVVVGESICDRVARISRLAVIEFAVDDDSDSDAPAYVHEDGVFQAFALSLINSSESHAPGIVLDTYR